MAHIWGQIRLRWSLFCFVVECVVVLHPSDTEEGVEGDPHQHSFLDVRFPGTPKRDHGRLSKGEGGLVCSQPHALLQRKSVFVRAKETQLSAILWSRGAILL